MAMRLDVAALISLVGEDKLREELNKNTWYLQFIDNSLTSRGNGNRFNTIEVFSINQITTANNPIEYLLFNDADFFRYIAFKMINVYDHTKFDNDDDYSDWLYNELDFEHELSLDVAEYIWKAINEYNHDQIKQLFEQDDYNLYLLYDKDHIQVLPNNFDKTKKFLNQWFPK